MEGDVLGGRRVLENCLACSGWLKAESNQMALLRACGYLSGTAVGGERVGEKEGGRDVDGWISVRL